MNEALDIAQTFKEYPDLFPWVVLAIILIVAFKERDTIREFFASIISARKETTVFHAQQNELIRNNTAALENNTQMLGILHQERANMIATIEQHEQLSAERVAHLQTVINRIDRTVIVNSENIKLVEDRTKGAS